VIHANDLALFTNDPKALNQIYNVACGDQISLNQMILMLKKITGKNISPKYGPERFGDVKHSKADISKIKELLGYKVKLPFYEGLEETYNWYIEQQCNEK
jgi:UDP-N-acetylglucosamine 4-epimerase